MSKTLKPGKQEFTVQGACPECMHMGWCLFNDDTEVQRCGSCSVFKDDGEAVAYAIQLAVQALKNPKRRTGKRFKALLFALEATVRDMRPDFWIGGPPNPEWVRSMVEDLCLTFQGALDGATSLSIAYTMQDEGLIYAPDGEDAEIDYEWLREHLDHDELETILRDAGCEETPDGNWRVAQKNAA